MKRDSAAWDGREPLVLAEDEELIALAKPSGMLTHGDGRSEAPSLADWLAKRYPGLETVGVAELPDGHTVSRSGIVHRLDAETSGVVIAAKDEGTFTRLSRRFERREVRKVYHAVVYGVPKEERGAIDFPIGRSAGDFRRYASHRTVRGAVRDALTRYKVLAAKNGYAYLELFPETGRRHQIRVHLSAIGHPVLCDSRYAPLREAALGFKRLALHARSITLPGTEGERTFEAPFPPDFVSVRKTML